MQFHRSNHSVLDYSHNLSDQSISSKTTHKDLGLILHNNLNWTNQYDHICSAAYLRIGVMLSPHFLFPRFLVFHPSLLCALKARVRLSIPKFNTMLYTCNILFMLHQNNTTWSSFSKKLISWIQLLPKMVTTSGTFSMIFYSHLCQLSVYRSCCTKSE